MLIDYVNIYLNKKIDKKEIDFTVVRKGKNKFHATFIRENGYIVAYIDKFIFKLSDHTLYPIIYDYASKSIKELELIEVSQYDENYLIEHYKTKIPISEIYNETFKIFIAKGSVLYNKFLIQYHSIVNFVHMRFSYKMKHISDDLKVVKCIPINEVPTTIIDDNAKENYGRDKYVIMTHNVYTLDTYYEIINISNIIFCNEFVEDMLNTIHVDKSDNNISILIPRNVKDIHGLKFIESTL